MPGVKLTDVNPELVCVLCHGYFIDATAIKECLHSFCRSCIILYLEAKNYCPKCQVPINTSKPHLSLKPDKTRQDIVYKLVPGLFHSEMRRRQEFYSKNCHRDLHLHPEARGVDVDRLIYSPEDSISLSLEFYDSDKEKEEWCNGVIAGEKCTAISVGSDSSSSGCSTPTIEGSASHLSNKQLDRNLSRKRYLQCPAEVSMRHLKKFIRMKYELPPEVSIELFYKRESLPDDYSLMDIAYIYTWKRNGPMRFYYRIHLPVPVVENNTAAKEVAAPEVILDPVTTTGQGTELKPSAPAILASKIPQPSVTVIPQPETILPNETHPHRKTPEKALPVVALDNSTVNQNTRTKTPEPSEKPREKSVPNLPPSVNDPILNNTSILPKPKTICYREASFPSPEKPADPMSTYDFEEEKLPIKNLEKLVNTSNKSSLSSAKTNGITKSKGTSKSLSDSKHNVVFTTAENCHTTIVPSASKASSGSSTSSTHSMTTPIVTTSMSATTHKFKSFAAAFEQYAREVPQNDGKKPSEQLSLESPRFGVTLVTPKTSASDNHATMSGDKTLEGRPLNSHTSNKELPVLSKSSTNLNSKDSLNGLVERKIQNDVPCRLPTAKDKISSSTEENKKTDLATSVKSSADLPKKPSTEKSYFKSDECKMTTPPKPSYISKTNDVTQPRKQSNEIVHETISERIKRLEKAAGWNNKANTPQVRSSNLGNPEKPTMNSKLRATDVAEARQGENKVESSTSSNYVVKNCSNDAPSRKQPNGIRFDSPKTTAPSNPGAPIRKTMPNVCPTTRPVNVTISPNQNEALKRKRSEVERCIKTENGCLSVSLLSQSQQEAEAKKMKMVEPDVSIQLMSFSSDKNSDAVKPTYQNRMALSENSKAKENAACNESLKLCNSTKSNLSPPTVQPLSGQKRDNGNLLDLSSGTGGSPGIGSGSSIKTTKSSPSPTEKRRKMPPLTPLRVPILSSLSEISERAPPALPKITANVTEQKDFSRYSKESIEFLFRQQFNNNNNRKSEKLLDEFMMNCQNYAFTPPYPLIRSNNGLSPESARK